MAIIDSSVEKKAERLRLRVLESRAAGQVRYGEALAVAIAQCLAQLREAGASWQECRERLGVSNGTLSAWSKKYSTPQETDIVRVRITEDGPGQAPSSGLLLCTPSGHTLSGFTLGEAAQLLRALG